jgi:hypothetical protein
MSAIRGLPVGALGLALMLGASLLTGCDDEPAPNAKAPNTEPGDLAPNTAPPKSNDPVDLALASINANCPPQYPQDVVPVPEPDELEQVGDAQLMAMLGSWNPAARRAAARGFAAKGDAILPKMVKATESDNAQLRTGAALAIASVVSNQMRNPRDVFPDIADTNEARAKVQQKHAHLEPIFIKMTRDTERDVRDAGMSALSALQPASVEAARAMLAMVDDTDDHLAGNAIITFEKRFDHEQIPKDELIAALKTAMQAPLPRGRGHAMRIIKQLDEASQRQFIPLMLDHLDWQPDRDTMFGGGAQGDSVILLTKFKVKELVPRIPKLMVKPMRGGGLFEYCIKSIHTFGKDAKPILPELRAYQQQLEAQLPNAHQRHKAGLANKINKLKKAVEHVEGL